MNRKGCGRKRPWPNVRHYTGILLERLRKATNKLSQDRLSPGRDLNTGLPEYEVRTFFSICGWHTHMKEEFNFYIAYTYFCVLIVIFSDRFTKQQGKRFCSSFRPDITLLLLFSKQTHILVRFIGSSYTDKQTIVMLSSVPLKRQEDVHNKIIK
jgi:hypothetical protein